MLHLEKHFPSPGFFKERRERRRAHRQEEFKIQLVAYKNIFEQEAETVIGATAGEYFWQEVRYGQPLTHSSDFLYRGYAMIPPSSLPFVLPIVRNIAQTRLEGQKTTEFKWMMAQAKHVSERNVRIGEYDNLEPDMTVIAFYGDTLGEVKDVLTSLATHPDWRQVERQRQRQFGRRAVAPRHPGTNAFIDKSEKEWRSLGYNNERGYSEYQALDPDWRNKKEGLRTSPAI